MNSKSLFCSALAVMASAFMSAAQASTNTLPLVEGQDGRSYVIGDLQITSAELRPEESGALSDTDLKITLAAVDSAEGCKTYKGIASVYGLNKGSGDRSNQELAWGGRLDVTKDTAAMLPPVPKGATAHVVNKRNGKTVSVKVNDRGPYVKGRIIDLTPAAGSKIGLHNSIAPVEVKVCRKAIASAE